MNRLLSNSLLALFAVATTSAVAEAQVVDAANDFLGSYTGVQGGDLDVLSANVTYTGSTYILTTLLNGNVGTTPNALYVFGFNRGQGTARFQASLGLDGVLFDSVVILRPDTTVTVNRLVGGTSTNLAAGTATVDGARISATINASELPALVAGFEFTYNIWPRINTGGGAQPISDFAPNNSNVAVAVAPEAASLALTLVGMSGLFLVRRRK